MSEQPLPSQEALKKYRETVSSMRKQRKELHARGIYTSDDALFCLDYIPSELLLELLKEYTRIVEAEDQGKKVESEVKGDILELISDEAFRCLEMDVETETFSSMSEQLDLVVFGNSKDQWEEFIDAIGIEPESCQKIIVEAKNWEKKVDAKTLRSFCYIVEHKYKKHCSLGVIFARNGATGFDKIKPVFSDARAVQIIFHASTGKYVVVLDHEDILSLGESGELIRRLREKIRNVEDVISDHRERVFDGKTWKNDPLKSKRLTEKREKFIQKLSK